MSEPAGTLHDYFRSTAAYRVRIALGLKGVPHARQFVHLRRGDQRAAPYREINAMGLVPFWREGAFGVGQSLAIIEYLDELYPEPSLLPGSARDRAIIREMALTIAADIHPLGNLRVLDQLTARFAADDATRADWARHWIEIGFAALEKRLETTPGNLCHGDTPTLADLCLVPQVFNARRFGVDLARFPLIVRVDSLLSEIHAFRDAAPTHQPDAE